MTQFAQHFAKKAAKVEPTAPSVSKWNGVRDLLAEEVGLDPDDVYVATISKAGNVTVRFKQSDGAQEASVLVGMNTNASELEKTTLSLVKLASPRNCRALVANRDVGGWTVAAILVPDPGDALVTTIGASFPEAAVLSI